MVVLLFFLLTPTTSSAGATGLLVGVTPGFQLRGPDCGALKTYASQVCEGVRGYRPACTKRQGREEYLVPIGACLPESVKRLHGREARGEGPNCWGATMAQAGFRSASLSGGDDEFTFFTTGPLCRLVPPDEPIRKGDVGRILAPSEEDERVIVESHGFIYLSPDVCFSKNGEAAESPYLVQACEKVLSETYHVEGECRHLGADPGACKARAQAYRCETLQSYLDRSDVNREWRETLQVVASMERMFEQFYLTPSMPATDVRGLEASLTLLDNNLTAEVTARITSRSHEKVWFLQGGTILDAIKRFGYSPPNGFTADDVVVMALWFRVYELQHHISLINGSIR